MKQTNLIVFYYLGMALEDIADLHIGMDIAGLAMGLCRIEQWLAAFVSEIESIPMPDSRVSAKGLLDFINSTLRNSDHTYKMSHVLSQPEIVGIFQRRKQFEEDFKRECRNIDVFTVLPKGMYNTRALIETAENKFPEEIRKIFTPQIIYDLNQAGRCLAFDAPTACAFHILRGTESLILIYYEALADKPWPHAQRDWGKYIMELDKLPNVKKIITTRLTEIQKFDRNPYIHPEVNITLERAPVIFELCSGVMHLMAEEIKKLRP